MALDRLVDREPGELAFPLGKDRQFPFAYVAPNEQWHRQRLANVAADRLRRERRLTPYRGRDVRHRLLDGFRRRLPRPLLERRRLARDRHRTAVGGENPAPAVEYASANACRLHPAHRLAGVGVAVVGGVVHLNLLQPHPEMQKPGGEQRGQDQAGKAAHDRLLIPVHRSPPFFPCNPGSPRQQGPWQVRSVAPPARGRRSRRQARWSI